MKLTYLLVGGLLFLSGCLSSTTKVPTSGGEPVQNSENPAVVDLNPEDFKELVEKEGTFVLDVHIPEQKHIKGTDTLIPYSQIGENSGKLPQDKNTVIAVYCRSGSMSAQASEKLIELGYTRVYNLIGGRNAWETKGYPLE